MLIENAIRIHENISSLYFEDSEYFIVLRMEYQFITDQFGSEAATLKPLNLPGFLSGFALKATGSGVQA